MCDFYCICHLSKVNIIIIFAQICNYPKSCKHFYHSPTVFFRTTLIRTITLDKLLGKLPNKVLILLGRNVNIKNSHIETITFSIIDARHALDNYGDILFEIPWQFSNMLTQSHVCLIFLCLTFVCYRFCLNLN